MARLGLFKGVNDMGCVFPYRLYPEKRQEPEKPGDAETEILLIADYQSIRLDIAEIEKVAGSDRLTDDEQKSLDKSVVLMKVGAKMIKKILRARGYRELKPASLRVDGAQ